MALALNDPCKAPPATTLNDLGARHTHRRTHISSWKVVKQRSMWHCSYRFPWQEQWLMLWSLYIGHYHWCQTINILALSSCVCRYVFLVCLFGKWRNTSPSGCYLSLTCGLSKSECCSFITSWTVASRLKNLPLSPILLDAWWN